MSGAYTRLTLGIGASVVALALAGTAIAAGQNSGPADQGFRGRGPGRSWGAGGPGGPRGGMGGALSPRVLQRLDLTDAQKERVKGIVESHRDERRALADRVRTARAALALAMRGETLDEAGVRTRAAELAAVHADQAVAQARVFSEIYQILTPEQQTRLKAIEAAGRARRDNRQRGPRQP